MSPAVAEIAKTLDAWHAAAAKPDEAAYFAFFTQDAVFLGTDPGERWPLDAFRKWAHPLLSIPVPNEKFEEVRKIITPPAGAASSPVPSF